MRSADAVRVTLRAAGPRAILAEFDTTQQVRDYYAEATRRRADGRLSATVEVVPGAVTLLFDEVDDCPALARDLRAWQPAPAVERTTRVVQIPVVYDGPDLSEVAGIWGSTVLQTVRRHIGMSHQVAFIGFAPGFAYISGIPEALRVPRKARPRTHVPMGSVAVADGFTGIYPGHSPGGWQLIGHTEVRMWDPQRRQPAYLAPGDRVQFIDVTP
jgi:KipI family sensor histidine kinase inhibitor